LKFCERVVSWPPAHIVIEPVGTRNVRLKGGYAALLMVLTLMLLVVMRADVRLPERVRAAILPVLMFEVTMLVANIFTDDTLDVTAYQSDSQYNYFPLIVSSIAPPPTIQVSSLTTWNIQSKIGGALNYGSYIPAGGVSIAGTPATQFPAMYVSTILQYDGGPADQGYILLRSCDGVSPIPKKKLMGQLIWS